MMDFLILKAYAQAGKFPNEGTGGLFPNEGVSGLYSNEGTSNASGFNVLLNKILDNIVIPIIFLLIAVGVVYFLWGVVVFIQNADNPEKREEGYKHMIWGIIGIFIMVSARGIVNIITSTMGVPTV